MEQQNKLKDSFLQFFHDLFDLMVVNGLWLLCSLPLITAGCATCALYTVTLKLARGEPVNPVRDFFKGIAENFKAGLLLGLLTGVLIAMTLGDAWFAFHLTGWPQTMYIVIALILGVLALILMAYAFPLQAMFQNSVKQQIINAFKLAFVAPGKTIALWLILLIPVLAPLVLPMAVLNMLGFLYLVVGFSGPAYGASRILRNIFDRVNGSSQGETPPNPEE